MIRAYNRLHDIGVAHSVEVWNNEGKLVGGLYGLLLGRIFYGESMFATERDASKVGLVRYVARSLGFIPDFWVFRQTHALTFSFREIYLLIFLMEFKSM